MLQNTSKSLAVKKTFVHYRVFLFAFFFLMSLYYLSYSKIKLPVVGELDILLPIALNVSYFAILGIAGLIVLSQTKKWKQGVYAPLVLFIQHFGFSLGLLYGFIKKP